MRINEKEIFEFSIESGSDKNGRVNHKITSLSNFKESSNKERWIKLKGNILFFYKINEHGGLNSMMPSKFLILELFKVKHEYNETLPFTFSLVFDVEPDKKHVFSCVTQDVCDDWVRLLKEASYQSIKKKVKKFRKYILNKTGNDPFLSISNLSTCLIQN